MRASCRGSGGLKFARTIIGRVRPRKPGDRANIDLYLGSALALAPETYVADWLSLTTEEFAADRIAVLPVAPIEQHGPHLPVGADTCIAQAYLERVRALLPNNSPAVFLPVQAVGASDEHRAFRGTLTLSPETALAAFIEIGESVARAGIAKLVFINSHGGNITLIDLAARQLRS